jgi:hypothetical protein
VNAVGLLEPDQTSHGIGDGAVVIVKETRKDERDSGLNASVVAGGIGKVEARGLQFDPAAGALDRPDDVHGCCFYV